MMPQLSMTAFIMYPLYHTSNSLAAFITLIDTKKLNLSLHELWLRGDHNALGATPCRKVKVKGAPTL